MSGRPSSVIDNEVKKLERSDQHWSQQIEIGFHLPRILRARIGWERFRRQEGREMFLALSDVFDLSLEGTSLLLETVLLVEERFVLVGQFFVLSNEALTGPIARGLCIGGTAARSFGGLVHCFLKKSDGAQKATKNSLFQSDGQFARSIEATRPLPPRATNREPWRLANADIRQTPTHITSGTKLRKVNRQRCEKR
jgi:hypothetical protein